jgi:hypothetical protein
VFIEAFAFEKSDEFFSGVPLLIRGEIDHHAVCLHDAVNRRLHRNSPLVLQQTKPPIGTKSSQPELLCPTGEGGWIV